MKTQKTRRPARIALIALAVVCVAAGGWYFASRPARGANGARGSESTSGTPVSVEVIHPEIGGIQRKCTQPGTIEPFEYADLYAKASGFLVEQTVDIGSRVKAGDTLARLSVPEDEKHVQRDEARLRDANSKVRQMESHLKGAQAEARAADAAVKFAMAAVRAKTAYLHYREKQLKRIKELADEHAIEAKLVDEQEDFYLSALEAQNAAKEQVEAAKEKAAAAYEKIPQAEADLAEARAEVGVAEAELATSKVLLDYTIIKSPYTGVVTARNFHIGDFIKSAEQGGTTPLLQVERTDLMRLVVQVPDRDVPYVSLGDPATFEIDALPGVEFKSRGDKKIAVARWADAEDPNTRTMRTEIDVPNPDNTLRRGMYGHVTITLEEGTPNAVRVPSSALIGKADGGRGKVRVVRDGRVHIVSVRYASDSGIETEIVSGLSHSDQVVVRATGPVDEGTPVTVAATHGSGH